MEFSIEHLEKLKIYMQEKWFQDTCTKLNIYDSKKTFEENLKTIKQYILLDLKGKYSLDIAIQKFWDSIETYKGEDFPRWVDNRHIEDGFIMTDLVLPISNGTGFSMTETVGFRTNRI